MQVSRILKNVWGRELSGILHQDVLYASSTPAVLILLSCNKKVLIP